MTGGVHPCEIWKPVPGFEATHEASNMGRVRSLPRWRNVFRTKCLQEGKVLNPVKLRYGAFGYALCCGNGGHKAFPAAVVIAMAHVQNPHGFRFVRPKDGDYSNLVASNLEWVEKRPSAKGDVGDLDYKIRRRRHIERTREVYDATA